MSINRKLYRAAQVRGLDRLAIEGHGIPGYELMNRAGQAAFRILRARWPEARALTICCGAGNNGGDGYVIARLAREAGLTVQLIALKDPGELGGDAARAARDWLEGGGGIEPMDERLRGDVIVDALLGTGLDRPAEGDWARMIAHVNDSGRPVLAVDIPSGLNADTGMPLGPCVRADVTVTFIGNKRGLWTGQAGRWCGERRFDALQTPSEIHQRISADAELLSSELPGRILPPRSPDTHKGDLGHVLIIGGDEGMAGAAILAGQAALRSGSGLVSLATRATHAATAVTVQPELMSHAVEDLPSLDALIERADVLALGPGLGQSDWSKAVWLRAMQSGRPLVVDADGLNLLSLQNLKADNWVLTPHPGEAARLLGWRVDEIQADRYAAVRALAERYAACVVLKGHGSLVAAPTGEVAVCPFGNPAMATAGMGDALTGIIASLIGQGLASFDAARLGVLLHAQAGDRAARAKRQILAGDLIAALADVLPA
jgi:ADP-dependent NAD(P)H-hydrate dehydratase / NAD(P)H-hydrate epimerase